MPRILPVPERARELYRQISELLTEKEHEPPNPFSGQQIRNLWEHAGDAIGSTLLSNFGEIALDGSDWDFLSKACEVERGGGALAGLRYAARLSPERLPDIIRWLRRALGRGNIKDVQGACIAIADWASEPREMLSIPLPSVLIEAILDYLEHGSIRCLASYARCANALYRAESLNRGQVEVLAESIRSLLPELGYGAMPSRGTEAIGLTVARAECVKLALLFKRRSDPSAAILADWLADGADDPLPEIRMAFEAE
jgi:hypothetical protein